VKERDLNEKEKIKNKAKERWMDMNGVCRERREKSVPETTSRESK